MYVVLESMREYFFRIISDSNINKEDLRRERLHRICESSRKEVEVDMTLYRCRYRRG